MNYAKILGISITLIGVTITIFDTAFARDLIDDKEKEEINKLIEAYIMEHPEVIIKSIDEMRKRQQREEQEAAKKNLIIEILPEFEPKKNQGFPGEKLTDTA